MKTRTNVAGFKTVPQIAEWAGLDRWRVRDEIVSLATHGDIDLHRLTFAH